MLLSMTGFGKAKRSFGDKNFSIEVRTLNSKFIDLKLKIPQNYKEKEIEIRKIIATRVKRGKVDLVIDRDSLKGEDDYGLDKVLFTNYYEQLKDLSSTLNITGGDMITSILRLPNVVAPVEEEIDPDEWSFVEKLLRETLELLVDYRTTEGESIENDLLGRIKQIQHLLSQVEGLDDGRVKSIKDRLYKNLEQFVGGDNIDQNRFEQEVIYYLEKLDINEEKVRLSQHCSYFLEQLEDERIEKGRKLTFITQEMGREINTMGAKANSSEIQRLVIMMKDELEKIKEQLPNVV